MRPVVREAFVAFTSPLEGVVPWMYLDVKGLVTVAIGNLIDPIQYALDLPFAHPDGRAATREEIHVAWLAVKGHKELAQQGHRPAARVSDLRLTPEGIEQVVGRALAGFDAQLGGRFDDWASLPADAQLATLAMAWACGAGFHFPGLVAALRAGDFLTAALSCTINETGNAGVRPRNVAMRQLYLLAAIGTDGPDALHWPAAEHVQAFQRAQWLTADGLVGPLTVKAARHALGDPPEPVRIDGGTVHVGSYGEE